MLLSRSEAEFDSIHRGSLRLRPRSCVPSRASCGRGVQNEADVPLQWGSHSGGRKRAPRSQQDKTPVLRAARGASHLLLPTSLPPPPKSTPRLQFPSLGTCVLLTLNRSDPSGLKSIWALSLRNRVCSTIYNVKRSQDKYLKPQIFESQ